MSEPNKIRQVPKFDRRAMLARFVNVPVAMESKRLDALAGWLSGRNDEPDFMADLEAYCPYGSDSPGYELIEGVAVIPIKGILIDQGDWIDAYFGFLGYNLIRDAYAEALSDPQVERVLFEFNTPGGLVAGCFDLADDLRSARGEKPTVAVVNEMALSAGYALASQIPEVFVPRTGYVGSVGVYTLHADFSKMLKDKGVEFTFIYAGAKKIDGNPYQPLSDEARKDIQDDVNREYELFVSTVAKGRAIPGAMVRGTEADTFQGDEGLEIGFADDVKNYQEVLERMIELGKPVSNNSILLKGQRSTMGIFGKANKEPKEPDGQEPATTAEPNPDGSSAIAQASAKADADNVVNLATEAAKKAASEAATQAIEGERKRAAGINDLCKLAKRPDLAGELIASGKSVEEARAALAESADNGDEISSFVNGAKPGNAADRTERLKANCEKRLERINARRKAGF